MNHKDAYTAFNERGVLCIMPWGFECPKWEIIRQIESYQTAFDVACVYCPVRLAFYCHGPKETPDEIV